MRAARGLWMFLVCASAVACTGDGGRLSRDFPTAVSGGTTLNAQLVGTWRRAVFFFDGNGIPRSSETIWTFRGDGSATRTVIARNFADGIADAITVDARWRVEAGVLVITFSSDGSTTRLSYRVEGTKLFLESQQFDRT